MKRFLKKVLSISLCATLIGSTVNFFPVIAPDTGISVNAVSEETPSSSFNYQQNDDGSITITGYNGNDTDVIIPQEIEGKSVTAIGDYAFYFCKNIINVKIPDSVTNIGYAPFIGCEKIKKITIGKNFTRINNSENDITQLFTGCHSLTEIIVDPDNNVFSSDDGVLFDKEKTTILFCSRNKVGDYSIPNSVKSIGIRAFSCCTKLTSITIPKDVYSIGYQAFYYCTGLTDIVLPETVKYIDAEAFNLCAGLTEITLPNDLVYIGKYAFGGCKNLLNITISNKIRKIDGFISCQKLTSVHIPNNVNTIENYAFDSCTSLTSIYIPDSVKSIGSSSFSGCDDLTIYCSVGSYAEAFANSKGFKVVEYDFSNENISNNDEINAEDNITNFVYYIDDYSNTAHITKYTGNDKSVIIPDKIYNKSVTSIENYAFQNCDSIKNVVMPDSITSIGEQAFSNCNSLESISISKNLTSISSGAFSNCINLTSVSIPDSVIEIYWAAFKNCTNLRSVKLSKSVMNIYDSAFEDCPNIEEFVVDNENSSFASIDGVLFDKEKTILIKYPPAKSDTSYIVPATVCGIGFGAFNYCNNLTEITISDNTDEMLYNLSFGGCKNLTAINANDTCRYFSSEDGVLYNKDKTELLMLPAGKSGEFIVPDTVTKLGDASLWLANNITKIAVPDSVKEADCSMDNPKFVIYGHSGSYIESYANSNRFPFVDDYVIINNTIYDPREIFTPASSFEYTAQNGNVIITKFIGTETDISIPISINGNTVVSIENKAFQNNKTIKSVIIPDSVVDIGSYAFQNCSQLTNVTLSNKIKNIDSYAFFGCTKLDSISIPDSVNIIGKEAFGTCLGLKSVTIPDSVTSLGDYAFYKCSNLESITIPNSITNVGNCVLKGCAKLANSQGFVISNNILCDYIESDTQSENVVIPDGIIEIGASAFATCKTINTITIPDSVSKIDRYAFSGCSNLQCVNIPDGITVISDSTFRSCTELTNILLPPSVTSIENFAFIDCKKINSINLPNGITKIGYGTFNGCNNLTNIKIPDSVITIETMAFRCCTSIKNIIIPNNVTNIDNKAFWGCTNLSRIIIPDSVNSIGNEVFDGCDNLTIFGNSNSYAENYAITNNISFEKIAICHIDKLSSTCTDYGKMGYYYYSGIDDIFFADENCTIEISDIDSWGIIPATGHNYITEVVEPTCTEQGYTLHICEVCGDSYKDNYTDPLPPIVAESVKLSKRAIDLTIGQTVVLTAIVKPDDAVDKTVTWYTTDKNVATVKDGKVTAVGKGTCTVFAKTANGKKGSCTVTVSLPMNNTSVINSDTVQVGDKVRISASANGGAGDYKYAYYYKRSTNTAWKTLGTEWGTNSSVSFTPTAEADYDVKVIVKDSNGTTSEKLFTVTVVKELELTNVSVLQRTNIKLGSAIPMIGKAVGGTAPYTYAFYFKRSTNTNWKPLGEKFGTLNTARLKPTAIGEYDIRIDVKDKSGTVVKKYSTATVK